MTKKRPFADMYKFESEFLEGREGNRVRIYINNSWPRSPAEFSEGAKKLEIREGKVLEALDWKTPSFFPRCGGGPSLVMHVDKKGCGNSRNIRLEQADYTGNYLYYKIGRIEIISSK
jgi:hypothetical protein